MTRFRILPALLSLVLLLSAASPWPQPWSWKPDGQAPALTLLLGGQPVRQEFEISPQARVLDLVLKKYRMEEDSVVVLWQDANGLWLKTQKKIPGSQSAEAVLLPPGSLITMSVNSRSGTLLAEITLRRK